MRGGRREGAGRKKGSQTRRTSDIAKRAASEGVSPLEFMLRIMREGELPEDADAAQKLAFYSMRFEAAKASAPYMHPRLAAVEHTGKDGGPVQIQEVVRRVV